MTAGKESLVTRAGPAHAEGMAQLWVKSIELLVQADPAQFRDPGGYRGFAEYLRTELGQGNVVGFVAHAQGRMVGFIHGEVARRPPQYRESLYAAIDELFVEPAQRGAGTGSALVRAFEDWARGEGIRQIELSSHLKSPLAQAFWTRRGYLPYADFRRRTLSDGLPAIDEIVEGAIRWALRREGDQSFLGKCYAFVEAAVEQGNSIVLDGQGTTAREAADAYGCVKDGMPPRGAYVLFDYTGPIEGVVRNWGHIGLSLGEGRVVHAWRAVQSDSIGAIERLESPPGGTSPIYLGYVPIERVLVNAHPR